MSVALQVEKTTTTVRSLALLGYFFVLCAFIGILKISVDAYRENQQSNWPRGVATITQRTVRKIPTGNRGEWFIELALRYDVSGEEMASSTRSRGGAFWEEISMRRWAAGHPLGTPLRIRYDPQHPLVVVPDEEDMPESGPQVPDDLKMILLFAILYAACVNLARLFQGGQQTVLRSGPIRS
jgi:hypothetical protein